MRVIARAAVRARAHRVRAGGGEIGVMSLYGGDGHRRGEHIRQRARYFTTSKPTSAPAMPVPDALCLAEIT